MLALLARATGELIRAAPGDPAALKEDIEFLRWMDDGHFVFLGARIYEYPRTPDGGYAAEEPDLPAGGRPGRPARSGPPGAAPQRRSRRCCRPPLQVSARGPRAGDRRQVEPALQCPPPGGDGLCRRAPLRRRRQAGRRDPLRRPVHRPRLQRRAARDAVAAPQGGPGDGRGRLRRRQPQRHASVQYPGDLPRDELFQISTEELLPMALGRAAPLRPAAHQALRPARSVRSLRLDPVLRAARPIRRPTAPDGLAEILAAAYGGVVISAYPTFSDAPLARVHYILQLSGGRCARARSGGRGSRDRPGGADLERRPRGGDPRRAAANRDAPAQALATYAPRLPARLSRPPGRDGGPGRSRGHRRPGRRTDRCASAPSARPEDTPRQFRFKLYHRGDVAGAAGSHAADPGQHGPGRPRRGSFRGLSGSEGRGGRSGMDPRLPRRGRPRRAVELRGRQDAVRRGLSRGMARRSRERPLQPPGSRAGRRLAGGVADPGARALSRPDGARPQPTCAGGGFGRPSRTGEVVPASLGRPLRSREGGEPRGRCPRRRRPGRRDRGGTAWLSKASTTTGCCDASRP